MTTLTDADWLELLCRAAEQPHVHHAGGVLPAMPEASVQMRTVGQAGAGAMREAWAFAAQCLGRFRTSPLFAAEGKVLLDFGTGWGRIARCFLRDFRAENIVGVDVDPDLIAICRSTFLGPRFLTCRPSPPLDLPDASVDFVVGYSVFSHLSEAASQAWVREFARILKPGGMAALTTRGRWFFDYASSLKHTATDGYALALSRMFPDFEAAKLHYDRGEFVHSNAHGVTGGGILDSSFYGESFIPERYARDVLGKHLPLDSFLQESGHPVLVFARGGAPGA